MKQRALTLKLLSTFPTLATATGPVFAMLDPPGVEDAHGDTMDAGALRLPPPGPDGLSHVPLYFMHSYHESVVAEAAPEDRVAIGSAVVWSEGEQAYFSPRFFENTELSEETKRGLESGEITACSVGYLTRSATPNGKGPKGSGEDVHEARLIEVSLVDLGAKAGAVRVKTMTNEDIKKLVQAVLATRADVEALKTKSIGIEMMCNSHELYFATEMMRHMAEAVAACQSYLMKDTREPALAQLAETFATSGGEMLKNLVGWLSSGAARGEPAKSEPPPAPAEGGVPAGDSAAVTKWLHGLLKRTA
jgi:hypothetical protein